MKLGVTLYGPSAPLTLQFGKYETLTRTGTPTRSTSNEIESEVIWTSLTSTDGFDRRFDRAPAAVARGQSSGPEVARCTFHWSGSMNHDVAGPAVLEPWTFARICASVGADRSSAYTHPSMWSSASVATTGSFASPTTRSESATSNTAQVWLWGVPATSA